MTSDWAMVQTWCARARDKLRSKKAALCNIVFPPLPFIMIKHIAYRVIINDALVAQVVVRVMDPPRALITGPLWSNAARLVVSMRRGGGVGSCGTRPQRFNFLELWCCHQGSTFALMFNLPAMNMYFFWALEFVM